MIGGQKNNSVGGRRGSKGLRDDFVAPGSAYIGIISVFRIHLILPKYEVKTKEVYYISTYIDGN